MSGARCVICKRFTKHNMITMNGLGQIVAEKGDCSRHGLVNIEDYDFDDFVEADDEGNLFD